ncbi:MAG: hypothetical protein ACSHYA_12205 [Opitutaceae bacterium]
MKILYPVFILILAGLCYYAGYTKGSKKVLVQEYQDAPTQVANDMPPVNLAPEPAEPMDVPVAVEEPATEEDFAQRALKKQITFTDSQGRELVAEVIEANSDNLKVRRAVDQMIVTLPLAMLSERDRAFAAYLAAQAPVAAPTPATSTKQGSPTEEDLVWEELFKDL